MDGMNTLLRACAVRTVLAAGLSLTACSSSPSSAQQSFPYAGSALDVINDNANMAVTVTAGAAQEVAVEVRTQTVGRSPQTPAWSLNGDTLILGTPCGASWVGYCEASFAVRVPDGTTVRVNGQEAVVG